MDWPLAETDFCIYQNQYKNIKNLSINFNCLEKAILLGNDTLEVHPFYLIDCSFE